MRLEKVILIFGALVAVSPCGAAARKAKPARAPQARKPALAVKGAPQLAGDNGKMGVAYTLGKGNDAVTFSLLSAEFSTARIIADNRVYVPKADEKYLVLHYTLHNSQPRD